MELSIIIVNYNVKYYLHELIQSLRRSKTTFEFEIIVVDNASQDGSIKFLQEQAYHGAITVIANQENVGFSAANNQGIRVATGELVLLLNPDTMIMEHTLQMAVQYMNAHLEVGALGVKMVDGSGSYLPESKRGFPSPWTSFCKVVGLADLFPRSRIFNQYYLGDLRNDEIQDVDVLTGAFFLTRSDILKSVDGLDESFFMYGEDIDLSYRIKKEGYDVVYYPHTSIIHYKGESTDKDSIAYIRRFYGAMNIFTEKHFGESTAAILALILQVTIFFRIVLLRLQNVLRHIAGPLAEFAIFLGALAGISSLWATYYHGDPAYYSDAPLMINLMMYAGIWVITSFLFGAYDDLYPWTRLRKSHLISWILILLVYASLSEYQRFSRTVVLAGVPVAGCLLLGLRYLFGRFLTRHHQTNDIVRTAVVGSAEELDRLTPLLSARKWTTEILGRVHLETANEASLGPIDSLDQIVRFHRIDELVFSLSDIRADDVMFWMNKIGPKVSYRMAPSESMSLIGSSSKDFRGMHHTIAIQYAIALPHHRRNKRLLDAVLAIVFLCLAPILLLIGNRPWKLFKNIFSVLRGSKTWVGYVDDESGRYPKIKTAVLNLDSHDPEQKPSAYYYARDYQPWLDMECIFTNLKNLDA